MITFPDIDRTAQLVRNNWLSSVQPRGEEFAALFYQQLFVAEPGVRSLFPSDRRVQNRALLAMLDLLATQDLHAPDMKEQIRALGRRHLLYGVPVAMFLTFGKVLQEALESLMKEEWNTELAVARSTMYRHVYEVIVYDYVL
jgi:hemoglobin-like flavoprotein